MRQGTLPADNMNLLIEHPGTSYYSNIADKLKTMLEFDFDSEVDVSIGSSDKGLILYKVEGQRFLMITEMHALPTKETVRLLLS